jgi:carboxyl-terminal processing protease
LFIEQGPIVQIKSTGRKKEVLYDRDKKNWVWWTIGYYGNSFSASAEILAAAIQDYKRGIIGSKQTYGKGTVRNVIDLNRSLYEIVRWVI